MISNFIAPTQGRLYEQDLLFIAHQPWVILFQGPVDLSIATVLDDLDECDFSGYARVQPVWPASTDPGNGDAASLSPAIAFTHDGGPTANDVYGMAVVEDDGGFGTHLLRIYAFPVPISMESAGDNISRQIRMLTGQYPLA